MGKLNNKGGMSDESNQNQLTFKSSPRRISNYHCPAIDAKADSDGNSRTSPLRNHKQSTTNDHRTSSSNPTAAVNQLTTNRKQFGNLLHPHAASPSTIKLEERQVSSAVDCGRCIPSAMMGPNTTTKAKLKQQQEISLAITLVTISLLFICCNWPKLVADIYEIIYCKRSSLEMTLAESFPTSTESKFIRLEEIVQPFKISIPIPIS